MVLELDRGGSLCRPILVKLVLVILGVAVVVGIAARIILSGVPSHTRKR